MKHNGFSLIELVIALSVLGILASVAMPRFDLRARRVNATERQLAMTMLRAQQTAVSRQHDVQVLFDTAAASLILHADSNSNGLRDAGESETRIVLEKGVRFVRGSLTPGEVGDSVVSFRRRLDGMPVLTFHRSGSASESGGFYMGTERSAAGEKPTDARMFMVDRGTGLVRRFHLRGGTWKSD